MRKPTCKGCDQKAEFPESDPQWCGECYTKDPDHQFDDYIEDLQWQQDFGRGLEHYQVWQDEGGQG